MHGDLCATLHTVAHYMSLPQLVERDTWFDSNGVSDVQITGIA